MASVSLKNVKKTYRSGLEEVVAVENINLDIMDGELLVLLGPSGCGKSTTMRMIAGLEKITAGDIHINKRRVNDLNPSRRNIAMAFETYALYTHMTAAENLGFCLRARKVPKAEVDAKVSKIAKMLQLESILDKRPSELSGGHQQRLSLGRALIRNPDVFLLDEPLSHLDAKLRVQIRAEIRWLHNKLNTTMVYVTHDQIEALALADRIAIMNFGNLQQVGTPAEVFNRPANRYVATFLGEPAMNIVPGVLSTNQGTCSVNIIGKDVNLSPAEDLTSLLTAKAPDSTLSIGIRPQDITLMTGSETSTDQQPSISGIVKVVEFLGEKYILTTRVKEEEIVSIHDSINGLREGDKVVLQFDKRKLHFFEDNDTGNAIRWE